MSDCLALCEYITLNSLRHCNHTKEVTKQFHYTYVNLGMPAGVVKVIGVPVIYLHVGIHIEYQCLHIICTEIVILHH